MRARPQFRPQPAPAQTDGPKLLDWNNQKFREVTAAIPILNQDIYPALIGEVSVRDTGFPYFDIRRYGATTVLVNNATALNNAITSANLLGGGDVIIPDELYTFTSAIALKSNVTISGVGPSSELSFSGLGLAYAMVGSAIDQFTMDGVTISGAYSRAMVFVACSNVTLTWNKVSGGTVVGVDGTLGGFQFHHCTDVEVADNRFFGNGLTNSPGSEIAINGLGTGLSERIRIHHNRFYSTAVQFGILGFDCSYVEITHNWITGATGTASNNNGYAVALYRTNALAPGLMRNNTVSKNWIWDTTGSGVYLQNSLKTDVEGNHIWDVCTSTDDSTLPNAAISLNGASGATVRGNHILRPGLAGITISMPEIPGVGTITSAAGVTTFSLTQAGAYTSAAFADRDMVIVGGVPYIVMSFNGTTGCTLLGEPTFGATAFTWASSGDIVCTANEIEGAAVRQAIKLGGPLANVTVSLNGAKDCWGGFGNVTAAYPCSGLDISRNRVNGTTGNFGILGLNCFHSHFDDNTIRMAWFHGVEIAGGGDDNTANGNIIHDAGMATPNTWDALHCATTNSMVDATVARNSGTTTGSRYGLNVTGAGSQVGTFVSTGHLTAPVLIAQAASGVKFQQSLTLMGNATGGIQTQFGDLADFGSAGVTFSKAEAYLGQNTTQALTGVDLWTQSNAANASKLYLQRLNGDHEWHTAPAGTAAAILNTFWTKLMALSTAGTLSPIGDFKLPTVGKGLYVKEGANATMGTAVLITGTLVVNTTKVTANSRILLTCQVPGGTPGWLQVSARTPGTSFTILSSSATDTSTIAWLIVEPA